MLYLLKIIHCTNMSMKNRDTVILLPARNTVTIADSIIYSRLVKKKTLSSPAAATDITQKKGKMSLSTVLDYLKTADDLDNLCVSVSKTYFRIVVCHQTQTTKLWLYPNPELLF